MILTDTLKTQYYIFSEIYEYIINKWGKFTDDTDIELYNLPSNLLESKKLYEYNTFTVDYNRGIIKNTNINLYIYDKLIELHNNYEKKLNAEDYTIKYEKIKENLTNFFFDIVKINKDTMTISNYIDSRIIKIDRSTNQNYHIIKENKIDLLTGKYNEQKYSNSYNLADNIIDYINCDFFIGGSRQIYWNNNIIEEKVVYEITNYIITIYLDLNDIRKKLIFILSCTFIYYINDIYIYLNELKEYLILQDIDNTTDLYSVYIYIYNNILLLKLTTNCYNCDEYFNNYVITLHNRIMKSDTENIYSEYITYLDINLDVYINPIMITFFSKFIHIKGKIKWYEQFEQIIKYYELNNYITYNIDDDGNTITINTYLKGLATYTLLLLYDNYNRIDFMRDIGTNININNTEGFHDIEKIRKIYNNIIKDDYINNIIIQEDTGKLIMEYYNGMKVKCQYMHLLDLVYYILNPEYLYTNYVNKYKNIHFIYKNINDIIKKDDEDDEDDEDEEKKDKEYIIIFNKINNLHPSISSIIYILIDNMNININVHTYLINKYIESYHLGILFYGCIQDISYIYTLVDGKDEYSLLHTDSKNKFIFNPSYNYYNENNNNQQCFIIDLNISTPDTLLLFNYYVNDESNNNNIIYFKYIYGRYRPASKLLYKNYILYINKKLNYYLYKCFNYLMISIKTIYELFNNILDYNNDLKKEKYFYKNTKKHKKKKYDEEYNKKKTNEDKQKYKTEYEAESTKVDNTYNKNVKELEDKIDEKKTELNREILAIYNFNKNIYLVYHKLKHNNKIFKIETETTNFDYNLFINIMNDLNLYFFIYYYNKKNTNIKIPNFINYRFNSEKYITNINDYDEEEKKIVSKIDKIKQIYIINPTNIEDIYINYKKIDILPSINHNLSFFYDLYKRKLIFYILNKINKNFLINEVFKNTHISDKSYYFLICAKLIESIIKNVLINKLKNKISSYISDLYIKHDSVNIYNTKFSPTNLNPTLNISNIDIKNSDILYYYKNIIDNNINQHDDDIFIIYPNEYTNTNLLLQKYYVKYNDTILENMLSNNVCLYLLDNNNSTCIHNAVKIFNYKIIKKIIDKDKYIFSYEYEFIKIEFENHKNKMISSDYTETINTFIKTQFEEIKLLILSNDAYGNNILYNLHNSFKICFYIINEYITDYLISNKALNIGKLNIKFSNLTENYLNITCTKNNSVLNNDDDSYVLLDIIKDLQKKLDGNNTISIKTDIKNKIIYYSDKINQYESIVINKTQIIETYDKIIDFKKNFIYFKMWDLLLNNPKYLEESFNLSLIKILHLDFDNNIDDILKYLDYLEKFASTYFINEKYIDKNKNEILKFIYDLLVHLTKITICDGIEKITEKILYNYLTNIYDNITIHYIIKSLMNDNTSNNTSFLYILYYEYPEKFVKNSINIFSSLEEKVNFEPTSINELLQILFNKLENDFIVVLDDSVKHNLKKNVASYFDLFTVRVIKNWFVVCENTLKFIINHQRICNTMNILKD